MGPLRTVREIPEFPAFLVILIRCLADAVDAGPPPLREGHETVLARARLKPRRCSARLEFARPSG